MSSYVTLAIDFGGRPGDNDCSPTHRADVAELADALDSGSSGLTVVEVQVLSSAPVTKQKI
jgi:hypothetical protein